jgi:ketoreductase RED2
MENVSSDTNEPLRKRSGVEGRVAIVTGSSGGIGEGIARALSEAGARVVINSVSSKAEGLEVARSLGSVYVQADVEDDQQARYLVETTINHFGRLDILVNNAGRVSFIPRDDFEALTDDVWDRAISANLLAPWRMIRAAAPHLRDAGEGAIVNISSLDGCIPRRARGSIAYAVAKAALNHLTSIMAVELAPEIRVNAIAPGLVLSRIEIAPESLERAVSGSLLGRAGSAREIGELCVALCAPGYATGQVLIADGGLHAAYL